MENAARLRAMYAEIERTLAEEPHAAAHSAACAAFHPKHDVLAFPGGLGHFCETIEAAGRRRRRSAWHLGLVQLVYFRPDSFCRD
jgi:hypothetical protein